MNEEFTLVGNLRYKLWWVEYWVGQYEGFFQSLIVVGQKDMDEMKESLEACRSLAIQLKNESFTRGLDNDEVVFINEAVGTIESLTARLQRIEQGRFLNLASRCITTLKDISSILETANKYRR